MNAPAHVYEIFVRAPIDTVWRAITDPDYTRRYFYRTTVDSAFAPGGPIRYLTAGGEDGVEGTIVEVDPPRKLVMTWHVLYDAALAEEPPGRVEWTLRPADDNDTITRVTLRHGGLGLSPKTWANVRLGWVVVLDGLKTLLETGEPLGQVTGELVEPLDDVDGTFHRALALRANNEAWQLMDAIGRRDPLDDPQAVSPERLLEAAYTSAYHWRRAEGHQEIHDIRATWMISRAWVLAGNGAVALRYADGCLALCTEHDVKDFDLAYAHEARARAMAAMGMTAGALKALTTAQATLVEDPEDRDILERDLQAGPWFGIPIA